MRRPIVIELPIWLSEALRVLGRCLRPCESVDYEGMVYPSVHGPWMMALEDRRTSPLSAFKAPWQLASFKAGTEQSQRARLSHERSISERNANRNSASDRVQHWPLSYLVVTTGLPSFCSPISILETLLGSKYGLSAWGVMRSMCRLVDPSVTLKSRSAELVQC